MPSSVLEKLHKTWPELDLSICVLGRRYAKDVIHRQIDEKLLSSPLLKSLTYEIIYEGYSSDSPMSPEWTKLTRAISSGGGLRVLRIKATSGGVCGEEPDKALQLDVCRDSHLPALEEFTLDGSFYHWDDEHSEMFARSVDTSRLHTLNFPTSMTASFFRAFKKQLPGLKKFRIGRCGSGHVIADFVKSIEGLELLAIDGQAPAIDVLWPAIMQHKNTLKSLCLRERVGVARLEEVMNSFPSVTCLGWDVPYEVIECTFESIEQDELTSYRIEQTTSISCHV